MARIFLVLSGVAVGLLALNTLLAFALGDFGSASRRYSSARLVVTETRESDSASPRQLETELGQLEEAAKALGEQRGRFWPHVWVGIIASLVSLLVSSISVTYFVGTSRWCREVSDAYSMKSDFTRRSQRLKRVSFYWSLVAITLTLLIAGLGAAADPFASSGNPADWVSWHWITALVGFGVIVISFFSQYRLLKSNLAVIDEVMRETERIRGEADAIAN